MRLTVILVLLLAACARQSPSVGAEFDHWMEPDGTIHWRMTITPATWQQLGRGELLDGRHQHISRRAVGAVSDLINENLRRSRLCPGEWTMGEVRHFDDGYLTFSGSCDPPVAERT
jgi:hypothetical protein